jgi:hypothetical protein
MLNELELRSTSDAVRGSDQLHRGISICRDQLDTMLLQRADSLPRQPP